MKLKDHIFSMKKDNLLTFIKKSVMAEKQNAMKDVNIITEDSELLKEAFKYFDTLKIDIKEFRRNYGKDNDFATDN